MQVGVWYRFRKRWEVGKKEWETIEHAISVRVFCRSSSIMKSIISWGISRGLRGSRHERRLVRDKHVSYRCRKEPKITTGILSLPLDVHTHPWLSDSLPSVKSTMNTKSTLFAPRLAWDDHAATLFYKCQEACDGDALVTRGEKGLDLQNLESIALSVQWRRKAAIACTWARTSLS